MPSNVALTPKTRIIASCRRAGHVTSLLEPTGPGVRLESSIYAGWEVSLYYDPMLAKLIVWGETRAEAILRMRRALAEYRIGGVHTTIPFHQQMMDNIRYQGAQFDTQFVDGPDGFRMSAAPSRDLAKVAAIAAALVEHERDQEAVILGASGGERQRAGLAVEADRAHGRDADEIER